MVYSVWFMVYGVRIPHPSTLISQPSTFKVMNITLYRYRKTKDHIDGRLQADFGHLCDTVENAISALPAGTYLIEISKCNQHARKMPIVCKMGCTLPSCTGCKKLEFVSNNTSMPCYCPQLCPGNGMHNRHDGAIILGTFNCPGCLIQPKEAFDRVYQILRKSAERKHEITLTIIENYPKPQPTELTPFRMGQQILAQF